MIEKSAAAQRIDDNIKFCNNCQWWTHESGAISLYQWEEGFSVCGRQHPVTLYDKVVRVSLITHKDMPACRAWEPEVEARTMTTADIDALITEHCLIDIEDDDITDEEVWKVLREDEH